MLVKAFEGETIEEALTKVKRELGAKALVLSTEKKKGNLFRKDIVTITAAEPVPEPKPKPDLSDEELASVFPHRQSAAPSIRKTKLNRYIDIAETMVAKAVSPNRKTMPTTHPTPTVRPSQRVTSLATMHHENYENEFLRYGISPDSSRNLSDQIREEVPASELKKQGALVRLQRDLMAEGMKVLDPSVFETKTRWTAIGTAGVGKTTLLVKLALMLKGRGYEVSLVGCDQRKVIARREIASYAKLIATQYSYQLTLDKRPKSIQLVDTPALGNNPTQPDYDQVVDLCRGTAPLLVLDARLRLKEIMRFIEQSKRFHPEALAFTRLDLASDLGVIYDVLKQTQMPLLGASISDSFRMPFKMFTANDLAKCIINGADK